MAEQPATKQPRRAAERIGGLTDAVIAIALTLLVLDLRNPGIPHVNSAAELASALGEMWPQFLGFVIAFTTVARYWVAHHRMFRRMPEQPGVVWANFGFLFFVVLLPFTTQMLGTHSENPLAVTLFAGNLILASVALTGTRVLAEHFAPELVAKRPPTEVLRSRLAMSWLTGVLTLSIVVAWTASADVATYLWLLLFLAGLPGRLAHRFMHGSSRDRASNSTCG